MRNGESMIEISGRPRGISNLSSESGDFRSDSERTRRYHVRTAPWLASFRASRDG